jgi:hypothetical protein
VSRTQGLLRLYLAAELFTTAVLEVVLFFVQDVADPSYVLTYCLMRPVELGFVICLARPRGKMLFAAVLPLGALFWYHSLFSSIALVEGAVFEVAGLSAIRSYPILAIMWLGLACFDMGYGCGWELPRWAALNASWTYFWCALAFLLTGVFMDTHDQVQSAANADN